MMTSGRAGVVVPLGFIPMLRGDSASGKVGFDIELAEMPRPLLNGVTANFQAWFVPKVANPRFSGYDEFMASYQGEQINSLGAIARDAPDFFYVESDGTKLATIKASDFFKTLGLHVPAGTPIQSELVDAFVQVYNFRLAAHSSRLTRRNYLEEDVAEATALPRAFWPSGRNSRIVPDYERALIVGTLDLDVAAGQIPLSGLTVYGATQAWTGSVGLVKTADEVQIGTNTEALGGKGVKFDLDGAGAMDVFADMTGQSIGVTLADIDKARTSQAFAKLRTAYAGNDYTGFDNDDAIVAELMSGFRVPEEQFKRPWLLDSKRVPVGFLERHATDGASLDASVSQGRASAMLSLNVPANDVGGVIIYTVEVLPERLDERMSDEWLMITEPSALPNALRDVQRPEPVDLVPARRIDALHTTPNALYGYEPMNDVWNRSFTRLGGAFYQATPGTAWTEQRSGLWQTGIVDPELTEDHWLCPAPFPHIVFADADAPAFEAVVRHSVAISGLTQIGDFLAENNDDYDAVVNAGA